MSQALLLKAVSLNLMTLGAGLGYIIPSKPFTKSKIEKRHGC